MKKIFSTVAMAVVAFTAVVSMSSCQNDSPSSFNAAPQVPTTKTVNEQKASGNTTNTASTLKNIYKATIMNDVFTLFDVTFVRTIGSESKTYTFTNSTDMEKAMVIDDQFESAKGVKVSIKAIFKVKDNYQETLDKVVAASADKDSVYVDLKAFPDFKIQTLNTIKTRKSGFGLKVLANKLTKGDLDNFADIWNKMLSVDND